MDVNDDANEMPPNEMKHMGGVRRANSCINAQIYEMINERKNEYQRLKQQKDELLEGFAEVTRIELQKHELMTSIIEKRNSIAVLKAELAKCKARSSQRKDTLVVATTRTARIKKRLGIYEEKIEVCKAMVKKSENITFIKINNEKDGFNQIKLRVIDYEKQRIDELNRFVFDLIEIKPKLDEDILQKSTRTALKDARQTVYVNGRWILANDHVHYRITRSILPSDGDYLSYLKEAAMCGGVARGDSAAKDDDEANQLDDIDRHYHTPSNLSNRNFTLSQLSTSTSAPARTPTGDFAMATNRFAILSGLTYTVQFVNLISFYLNIVLPYNVPHNKFCTDKLKDYQFLNAVAKLNTNIVFLSIHQHIPVTNLLPKHTLENLYHFLTSFKNMRVKLREKHSIAFSDHMIPLLDEMFTDCDDELYCPDSMPNLIFNDTEEWETLPNSNEIPSDDTYNKNVPRNVLAASSSLISSFSTLTHYFRNLGAAHHAPDGK